MVGILESWIVHMIMDNFIIHFVVELRFRESLCPWMPIVLLEFDKNLYTTLK